MSEHALARVEKVDLASYSPREFNVLYPTPQVMRVSPFHEIQVSKVLLSVNDGDGDTYSGSFCKNGTRALSKNGLHKLFRAAGGEWVTKGCYFVDDGSISKKIKYRAEGRIPKQDGTWLSMVCHRDVDISEEYIQKHVSPKMLAAYLEHAPSMCESKAQNRLIRGLLQIKQVYTVDELRRPFVVPTLVYSPDFSDPEIRRVHALAAMGAQGDLMGARRELPGEVIDAEARVVSMREPDEAPTSETIALEADDEMEGDELFGDERLYLGTTLQGWMQSLRDAQTMEELAAIGNSLRKVRQEMPPEHWGELMEAGLARKRQLQGAA